MKSIKKFVTFLNFRGGSDLFSDSSDSDSLFLFFNLLDAAFFFLIEAGIITGSLADDDPGCLLYPSLKNLSFRISDTFYLQTYQIDLLHFLIQILIGQFDFDLGARPMILVVLSLHTVTKIGI